MDIALHKDGGMRLPVRMWGLCVFGLQEIWIVAHVGASLNDIKVPSTARASGVPVVDSGIDNPGNSKSI